MGIEPTSSAWKAEIIATIRHPLKVKELLDFTVKKGLFKSIFTYLKEILKLQKLFYIAKNKKSRKNL